MPTGASARTERVSIPSLSSTISTTTSSVYYEFDNWEESVKAYRDYVQYKYKGGDYYQFLQRIGYAEDPDYVAKVRQIARTL